MKGWVYIISNKSMQGLVKVGFSMKDPEIRAKDLDNTGSPHPFKVEYAVLVENPRAVEQTTHQELRSYHEGKEWFRCSANEAKTKIDTVIRNTGNEPVVTHSSILPSSHISSNEHEIWSHTHTLNEVLLICDKCRTRVSVGPSMQKYKNRDWLCDSCVKSSPDIQLN